MSQLDRAIYNDLLRKKQPKKVEPLADELIEIYLDKVDCDLNFRNYLAIHMQDLVITQKVRDTYSQTEMKMLNKMRRKCYKEYLIDKKILPESARLNPYY